jgi:hypothetical protein
LTSPNHNKIQYWLSSSSGSKLFALSAALFTSIQMSLNKSFVSFTLSNAVLGNINESSLIMATFHQSWSSVLRLRARFLVSSITSYWSKHPLSRPQDCIVKEHALSSTFLLLDI